MKKDRKWQIATGPSVKQEADRLGLIYESWEIVKLIPTAPIDSYEKIEVTGTITCHQCGKSLPFTKGFTWGMLAPSGLSCPDCDVEISIGAYDQVSGATQPLWIYASPFTESHTPAHRNAIAIESVDGTTAEIV